MRVVCAWCGVVLSEAESGPVSHGICDSCSLTVERAFAKSKILKTAQRKASPNVRRPRPGTLPLPGFLVAGPR
jgi:hypothetical protein